MGDGPEEEGAERVRTLTAVRSPLWAVAIAAALALGVGLRLGNLRNVSDRTPDERVCTRQANTVLDEGPSGLKRLVAEFRSDSTWAIYPSPTRAGYIWLLAAVMRATGVRDERAGVVVSCVTSIASLVVVTVIAMGFLPPWGTLAAVVLFAVSPMEIALARRAWQDALVGFIGLGLVVSASRLIRRPGTWFWCVVFVTLGSASITVKELAALAYGLILSGVLWVLIARHRDWSSGLAVAGAALAAATASVTWLAHAVGGFTPLVEIVSGLPRVTATLRYSLDYETGPAYRVLQGLWIGSPLGALLCSIGVVIVLLPDTIRRSWSLPNMVDRELVIGMVIFLVAIVALPMVFPHHQNLRYLSVGFGPFYLISGLGFSSLASWGWNALPRSRVWICPALACLVVAVGATADLRTFRTIFVRRAIPDLSVGMLLAAAAPEHAGRYSGRPHATPEQIRAAEEAVRLQPSPEAYLYLSQQYELTGRHDDCINACMRALELRPDYAEAYNNIAAAHASMARWDEAIQAAQQALALRPDFGLARENLDYSLRMKEWQQR